MDAALNPGEYRWPDTQTLADVVEAMPVLGIRRLIRIARQVAVELHLAARAGLRPGPITFDAVVVEYIGTPFEQALLQHGERADTEATDEHGLESLGALLKQLLSAKPIVLESSFDIASMTGGMAANTTTSDATLLNGLCRALGLIAERCARRDAAYYASPYDVAADLARLARITENIAARKAVQPPRVYVHSPHPRAPAQARRLPKVIIEGSAASRAERLWHKCAAMLRPSAHAAA